MGNVGGSAVARGRSEGSGGWMWVVPVVSEDVHVRLRGCHAGMDATASTAASSWRQPTRVGPRRARWLWSRRLSSPLRDDARPDLLDPPAGAPPENPHG